MNSLMDWFTFLKYSLVGLLLVVGAAATTVTPIENETPFKKLKDGLRSVTSSEELKEAAEFDVNENESTVSITVVGASGDLAKKKIFPALFALYYEGFLPKVCVCIVVCLVHWSLLDTNLCFILVDV